MNVFKDWMFINKNEWPFNKSKYSKMFEWPIQTFLNDYAKVQQFKTLVSPVFEKNKSSKMFEHGTERDKRCNYQPVGVTFRLMWYTTLPVVSGYLLTCRIHRSLLKMVLWGQCWTFLILCFIEDAIRHATAAPQTTYSFMQQCDVAGDSVGPHGAWKILQELENLQELALGIPARRAPLAGCCG